MNSIASFSGLASGIPWRDLIEEMMALERRPAQLLEGRISANDSRAAAWSSFEGLVGGLESAANAVRTGDAFENFRASVSGAPAGSPAPLSVSSGEGAAQGRYSARVLALAEAEKLSGSVFESRTEALGAAGEFLIGGVRVELQESDSLDTVRDRINAANTGSNASGVTASILSNGPGRHRLVLTADQTGKAGIDLVDGVSGALRTLGVLDATASIKHNTSNGALGDAFADTTTAIAELRGFGASSLSGTVTLGQGARGVDVQIDLATMSLEDVAAEINAAADDAQSGVSARVVAEELADGETRHRLEISGTTSFSDENRVLEGLGILSGGRSGIRQQVAGAALEAGGGTGPANTNTRIVDLSSNGTGMGAEAGDTLTITGTRGDGSSVEMTYTIGADDTLQDLLDRINDDADGYGAGDRTARATLGEDGRIVLTDDQGGDSRLDLAIIAHNEGGGTLDFGTMGLEQEGRSRQVTAGADAEVMIDGTYLTHATNTLEGALQGVTLNLNAAQPETTVTVDVQHDAKSAVESVKAMVDAYNDIVDFVQSQVPTGEEGAPRPPLASDSVLRSMQSTLRGALETTLGAGIAGEMNRLADVGIEVEKTGRYSLDTARLEQAIRSDREAVARLFGVHASASDSTIEYVTHSNATQAGTYAVEITQAAARAAATGTGFSGTYSGGGPEDTLTVRDLETLRDYTIELADGMTMDQIVDRLETEFATPTHRVVQAAAGLFTDPAGSTTADADTPLAELYAADGSSAGLADDTVITLSGTRGNGRAFVSEFTVVNAETQTVGSLTEAIQNELGTGVEVSVEDGVITARALDTGPRSFALTVSVEESEPGSPFGSFDAVSEGRSAAEFTAVNDGGQLRIEHGSYGAARGFEVEYGSAAAASIGLEAGTYTGQDVEGSIGGVAAVGSGRVLTGAEGSATEGLLVRHTGESVGSAGDLVFSRGVAEEVVRAAEVMTGTGAGSVQSILDRLGSNTASMNDRIDAIEARIDRRMEALVRQFTAMEEALSNAQAQSQWLMMQIGSLGGGMGL